MGRVTCDEDLPTTSELSDAEIIQLTQDSENDSATEVRRAIKCLQDFCLCSEVEPAIIDVMAALESQLNNIMISQAKKKKRK